MYLNFNSLQTKAFAFSEQFLSSLTLQQRKILAVATLALTCIAALWLLSACCFNANKKDQDNLNNDGKKADAQKNNINPKVEPPKEEPSPLLQQFISEIDRTMGAHIHDYQKQTLETLFNQAMAAPQPREAMEKLINEKINQRDGWGADKAWHIKKNLLNLLPANDVKKIASTPINANGDRLVCFYKTGPTEFLGNFADCPSSIKIWGQTFQCAEAAFQWRKYSWAAEQNNRIDMQQDPEMLKFATADGEEAFSLKTYFDTQYPKVYVNGWMDQGIRDQVMWEILQAKFSQNKEFRDLLRDTEGAYLLEHNNRKGKDAHWSDDHDGSGENLLGKMLMAIRDNEPCPPPGNVIDRIISDFAKFANQPGALDYEIFS